MFFSHRGSTPLSEQHLPSKFFCTKLRSWKRDYTLRHWTGSIPNLFDSTMECYATAWRLWRESRILYFLQSPPFPRISPLFLFVWIFFFFCPFNCGRAHLQARGLGRGTAMSTCTRLKRKKETKSLQKRLWNHLDKREKLAFRSTKLLSRWY